MMKKTCSNRESSSRDRAKAQSGEGVSTQRVLPSTKAKLIAENGIHQTSLTSGLSSFVRGMLVGALVIGSLKYCYSAWTLSQEIPADQLTQEFAKINTSTPEVASEVGSNSLESYTSLLAKEVNRIRVYEEKLKKRSTALEAILADTLELEPETNKSSKMYRSKGKLGVGGSDGPKAPIIALSSTGKRADITPTDISNSDFLDSFDEQLSILARLPLGVPVQGSLSSDFGWRRSPFGRNHHLHQGIDIAADYNDPVYATADGIVRNAGYVGAYGKAITIDHGDGYETLYGHLSRISVTVGQKICRGQQIGLVGSTGRSTGPHVHYEVRKKGRALDPEPFVSLATLLRIL